MIDMAVATKGKYPVLCKQGKTYADVIRLKDGMGNAIDLTGYTASVEIRDGIPAQGETTVLATLTEENGGVTIDPEKGKIQLYISAQDTAAFEPGSYYWELELESADGIVPYFMEPSKFKVTSEVNLLDVTDGAE